MVTRPTDEHLQHIVANTSCDCRGGLCDGSCDHALSRDLLRARKVAEAARETCTHPLKLGCFERLRQALREYDEETS